MRRRFRLNHSAELKAKVALASGRGARTLSELARQLTGDTFTGLLRANGTRISMNGKRGWREHAGPRLVLSCPVTYNPTQNDAMPAVALLA